MPTTLVATSWMLTLSSTWDWPTIKFWFIREIMMSFRIIQSKCNKLDEMITWVLLNIITVASVTACWLPHMASHNLKTTAQNWLCSHARPSIALRQTEKDHQIRYTRHAYRDIPVFPVVAWSWLCLRGSGSKGHLVELQAVAQRGQTRSQLAFSGWL